MQSLRPYLRLTVFMVRAAVTKIPYPGRNLLLTALEAGKSKVKALADSVSGGECLVHSGLLTVPSQSGAAGELCGVS